MNMLPWLLQALSVKLAIASQSNKTQNNYNVFPQLPNNNAPSHFIMSEPTTVSFPQRGLLILTGLLLSCFYFDGGMVGRKGGCGEVRGARHTGRTLDSVGKALDHRLAKSLGLFLVVTCDLSGVTPAMNTPRYVART